MKIYICEYPLIKVHEKKIGRSAIDTHIYAYLLTAMGKCAVMSIGMVTILYVFT